MHQQPLQQQRWSLKKERPQSYGRMKEQREEDYAPDLDQQAGATARQIIRATSVDDTAANWRALKQAYLRGHEDAQHK